MHDQIRVLAESKLNTIADPVPTTLADDKISAEIFHLILSENDKYNQMKEIRGRQKQGALACPRTKELIRKVREETMEIAGTRLLEELKTSTSP